MIPKDRQSRIAERLSLEVGDREDVGQFLFQFAALPVGHDLDLALEALTSDNDEGFKQGVRIVLEEIA